MSEKKDERDIDEILASIDAMLAETEDKPSVTQERQDVVKKAARDSEDALGLSSTSEQPINNTSKLQPFEPLDAEASEDERSKEDIVAQERIIQDAPAGDKAESADANVGTDGADSPRPRIVLTEEFLEPSAQESLPLWAAQAKVGQNETDDEREPNVEAEKDETNEDEASEQNTEETIEDEMAQDEPETIDDSQESIGDLDDFDLPDLDDKESSEPEDSNQDIEDADNHEEEQVDEAEIGEKAESVEDEIEAKDTEEVSSEEASTEDIAQSSDKADEFDAVFDAIANDDTITFDISEAMDEDTVYDIEVLDKELVEAFVHSAVEDADDAEHEKDTAPTTDTVEGPVEETTEDTELSADEIFEGDEPEVVIEDAVETKADVEIDDISEDDEQEIATEDTETEKEEATEQEELIALNPDELDPLIEAVSDEVRIKINHHLQQILPELISDALLEHLANQSINQSDKQDD